MKSRGKTLGLLTNLEKWWFEVCAKVVLTGEPTRREGQACALNQWFDVYTFRLGGTESRQAAVLFNNITERKQAEQALRTSGARCLTTRPWAWL